MTNSAIDSSQASSGSSASQPPGPFGTSRALTKPLERANLVLETRRSPTRLWTAVKQDSIAAFRLKGRRPAVSNGDGGPRVRAHDPGPAAANLSGRRFSGRPGSGGLAGPLPAEPAPAAQRERRRGQRRFWAEAPPKGLLVAPQGTRFQPAGSLSRRRDQPGAGPREEQHRLEHAVVGVYRGTSWTRGQAATVAKDRGRPGQEKAGKKKKKEKKRKKKKKKTEEEREERPPSGGWPAIVTSSEGPEKPAGRGGAPGRQPQGERGPRPKTRRRSSLRHRALRQRRIPERYNQHGTAPRCGRAR